MTIERNIGTTTSSLMSSEQRSILSINERGIIEHVNEEFTVKSKYEKDELVGLHSDILNITDEYGTPLTEIVNGKTTSWENIITFRTNEDSIDSMSVTIHLVCGENKTTHHILICEKPPHIKDEEFTKYANLMKHLHTIIFVYKENEHGELLLSFLEGSIARALKINKDSISLQQLQKYFCLQKLKHMESLLRRSLKGERLQFDIAFKNYYFSVTLEPLIKEGRIEEVVGIATDITSRVKKELEIKKLAYYDSLTKLPNRHYAKERIEKMINSTRESAFATIFIDFNYFKEINDSFGHIVGDEALQQVAEQLRQVVGKTTFVTRYGGDEFLLVVPQATAQKVEDVIRQIKNEITSIKLNLLGYSLPISLSVGSSFYPRNGEDFQTLVDYADREMYKEKRASAMRREGQQDDLATQSLMTKKLREAFARNTLRISYAPRIHAQAGDFLGLQAKISTTTKSILPLPIEELPTMTQDVKLVNGISQWALEEVCHQGARMEKERLQLIPICVGVTSAQFEHPFFVDIVSMILKKTAYTPSSLTLEVDSTVINKGESRATFHALKKIGIRISICNFDEAPISFQALGGLPIDSFKLSPVITQEQAIVHEKIISSIHLLAQGLGVKVIMERSGLLTKFHYKKYEIEEVILPESLPQLALSNRVKGYE